MPDRPASTEICPSETLYVSDLDGTLLGADGILSAPSRRGLVDLLERGLPFTVASARGVDAIRAALGDLPLTLPVIASDGGTLSELATGRHLRVVTIAREAARGAYARARAHGLDELVSTHTPRGDRLYVPKLHHAGVARFVALQRGLGDRRLRRVPDTASGLDEPVTCLTILARRPRLEALDAELQAHHAPTIQRHLFDDPYTVPWAWLTIHGEGASKAAALDALIAAADRRPRRIVAFGDQRNDLPLLGRADHAVATANALPEVRQIADEVIGHHADDAVVRWLQRHALPPGAP